MRGLESDHHFHGPFSEATGVQLLSSLLRLIITLERQTSMAAGIRTQGNGIEKVGSTHSTAALSTDTVDCLFLSL